MWLTDQYGLLSVLFRQVQVPSSDPSLNFAQLGIASTVCVLLLVWGLSERKEKLRSQAECSKLQEARVTREHELSEKVVPLLASSVDLLSRVPGQFDRALSAAESSSRQSDLDTALHQLEGLIDRVKKQS